MPDTSHRMRHDSPSTTGRLRKLKPIKCGGPGNNGCGVRLRSTGAPATLEHGGETTIETRRRQSIRVEIEARPFMGPAFLQELPKLPALWRDSVT
ncbi:MAG: hypothetical protein ACK5DM_13005, partial [Planctomyces sp.]